MPIRSRGRVLVIAVLVLVLVAGALVAGAWLWRRAHRTPLDEALGAVPAASKRIAFTDWAMVRDRLGSKVGARSSRRDVDDFLDKAYDTDFAAASSIDESGGALQEKFGFSPATADWEAYAQAKGGATMVLKLPDADFGELADNLHSLGFRKPAQEDGVWNGGVDLVASIDPTITPELQYVALLPDQHLVVTSDTRTYAAEAAQVAEGDGDSVDSVDGVGDLAGGLGEVADAILWTGDFACEDLAMSQADEDDQQRADQLIAQAGGVSPLNGLAMGMSRDRSLHVVAAFEDSHRAQHDLRPRARLAVGEAVGRAGSFADDFRLTSSKAVGRTVRLVLEPRSHTDYVLSDLYDGPVLFASC